MSNHLTGQFKSINLSLVIIILLFVISSPVFAQQPSTFEVYIELDYSERFINTSPDISQPRTQLTGNVTLNSRTPMHIEVNLTVDDDWSVLIEPANFTLIVPIQGLAIQDIIITIMAPLGIENNTEHMIQIDGTWSYIQGIGGGILDSVTFKLISRNNTDQSNGNGNNHDGDNNGVEASDDSFFEQYGTGVLIAAVVLFIIIIFIILYRRRRDYEDL